MREVSRRELPSFTAAAYGHLSSTASRSLLSRASSPRRPVSHPRVNVYLCIKQALFIRPMNMHCFAAVARCRVQTRRYHCLINHIQSQRPTLCTPFIVLGASPCSPFPALITPHADSPCHSPGLSTRFLSSCSPSRSALCCRSPTSRPQLTLIYVIFSGHPHVTALRRILDQTCPMCVKYTRRCGSQTRTKQHRITELRRMVIRGYCAIFETLIEQVNRERAGRETERTRKRG